MKSPRHIGLVVCSLVAATACSRRSAPAAPVAPARAGLVPVPGAPAVPAAMPTIAAAPAAPTAPSGVGGGTSLSTSGAPNFGNRAVTPGFVPDPIDVNVTSGGNLDVRAMNLGPGCVGFATSNPDFNIQLSAQDTFLRLYVTSDTDTTLIVNDAAGNWHCNDDSNGGTNPMVDLTNVPPGLINVWVGSYQAGTQARGVLHITEMQNNHP